MINRLLQRFFPARSDSEPPARPTLFYTYGDGTLSPVTRSTPLETFFSHYRDDYRVASSFGTAITAWAAISRRAELVTQIPLRVRDSMGVVLESSPVDSFVANSRTYLESMAYSYHLWGKVFLKKLRNEKRFPTALVYLNPLDVRVETNLATDQIIRFTIDTTPVSTKDMVFIHGFDPLDAHDGISSYEVAFHRIQTEKHLIRFAGSFFANSARPDGLLIYEGIVADGELARMQDEFKQFKGSANAFRTFVAGSAKAKWTWIPVTPPPADLAMEGLDNNVKRDICAAVKIHPVLVGLADASDPLSAGSTYEKIRQQHLTDIEVPFIEKLCQQLTEQWSARDFVGSFKGLVIEPDLTQLLRDSKASVERSTYTLNTTGVNAPILSVGEAREYLGFTPDHDGINRNPTWATELWLNGAITHDRYRESIGEPPDEQFKGMYIWQVDPRQQPVVSPFGLMDRDESPPVLPAPPLQLAPPTITTTGTAVLLSLANNVDLLAIQKVLKPRLEGQMLSWTAPDEFHCTLLYCPALTPVQAYKLAQAVKLLPTPEGLHLRVGSVMCFDNFGEYAVHVRVRRNTDLLDYQAALYQMAVSMGLSVSQYSVPDAYTPHITLGYASAYIPRITYAGTSLVTPSGVEVSKETSDGVYQITASVPLRQRAEVADPPLPFDPSAILEELRKWKARIKSKGRNTRFETNIIPVALYQWVRQQLEDGWSISSIFEAARAAAEFQTPPIPLGASPEEFETWWEGLADLENEIADTWLTYQARISPALKKAALAALQTQDVDSFIKAPSPDLLTDLWLGTTDSPGVLLKVFYAGMEAGDRALGGDDTATERKVAPAWNLLNQEAYTFLEGYAFDLIRGINETTRESIAQLLMKAVENGWSMADLSGELEKVLITTKTPSESVQSRARLIAISESGRAYNTGAKTRWQNVGIENGIWQTVRDDHVCRVCRSLHGEKFNFKEGVRSDITKKTYFDIAHPGCRCFFKPDVTVKKLADTQQLIQDFTVTDDQAETNEKRLGKVKTYEDATRFMKEVYPTVTLSFDADVPIAPLKKILTEFDRVVTRFPAVLKQIDMIASDRQVTPPEGFNNYLAYAQQRTATQPGLLVFNHEYLYAPRAMKVQTPQLGGWLVEGRTQIETTMTHELGHFLDYYLREQPYTLVGKAFSNNYGNTVTGLWREFVAQNRATTKLSEYSTTNKWENVAEAFAAYTYIPPKDWPVYVKRLAYFLEEVLPQGVRFEDRDSLPRWRDLTPEEQQQEYTTLETHYKKLNLKVGR